MTMNLALLLALCAALLPATARAQTTGPFEISGISDGRCTLALGDFPASLPGNTTTLSVPIQFECNAPFTLYAKSGTGFFRRMPPVGMTGDPELIGYDVLWPTGFADSNGRPIAPAFNAPGTDWRQGLIASSAATRQLQQSVLTIRLRPSAPSSRPIMPDTFLLQIEAN